MVLKSKQGVFRAKPGVYSHFTVLRGQPYPTKSFGVLINKNKITAKVDRLVNKKYKEFLLSEILFKKKKDLSLEKLIQEITLSIKEILENPEIIIDAKNELNERTGDDFIYKPLLGDRKPPLDYRKN